MAARNAVLPLEAEAAAELRLGRADALLRGQGGKQVHEAQRVVQVGDGVAEARVPLPDQMVERVGGLVGLTLARHVQLAAVHRLAHLLHERLCKPDRAGRRRANEAMLGVWCKELQAESRTLNSRNLLSSGSWAR